MNLNDNPIFLTQKRIAHRSGILAVILIALLVGLSLLAGLIGYFRWPMDFPFSSHQEAGRMFYGWAIGIEILILLIGAFGRISNVLSNERKAGLWDSNRLTPLQPSQLIIGYWFGPPLREFYMSAILAGIGFIIVVFSGLSPLFWFESQLLVFSTALFLGLMAFLAGLAFQRPQHGIALVVLALFLQFPSFAFPKFFITDFLFPVYAIVNIFLGDNAGLNQPDQWTGPPHIFGFPVYPVLLSLALQLVIGIFLWRVAIRRTANPFQPSMLRWEVVVLFAIFLFVQHGMIWGQWHNKYDDDFDFLPAVVHVGAMLLTVLILGLASPQPENIRVKAMRLGLKTPGAVLPYSSLPLALVLTVVAALALLTQFIHSFSNALEIYLIAVGNFLAVSVIFSLLLEYCRLRYQRRAIGFLALWLFVLCFLPFVLAAVFVNAQLLKFSVLVPGCAALINQPDENLNCLLGIVAGHLMIAFLIFIGWQREWKKLLARAV